MSLIFENVKYAVSVHKIGPQSFAFVLNNTFLEVNLTMLADGGSLIRFRKESHLTYVKEEVRSTVLAAFTALINATYRLIGIG